MNADNHETRDEYEDREEQHKYNLLLGEAQTLRELARKLETDLVDAAALHLADEQSVRNMERVIEELRCELGYRDADLARVTGERDAMTDILGVADRYDSVQELAEALLAACAPPASGEVKP